MFWLRLGSGIAMVETVQCWATAIIGLGIDTLTGNVLVKTAMLIAVRSLHCCV